MNIADSTSRAYCAATLTERDFSLLVNLLIIVIGKPVD